MLDEGDIVPNRRRRKKNSADHVPRQRWSTEEEVELRKFLATNWDTKTCPNTAQCKAAIALSKINNGQLQKRSYLNIKKKMSRELLKLKAREKE